MVETGEAFATYRDEAVRGGVMGKQGPVR